MKNPSTLVSQHHVVPTPNAAIRTMQQFVYVYLLMLADPHTVDLNALLIQIVQQI
jgi:hypothetical protein